MRASRETPHRPPSRNAVAGLTASAPIRVLLVDDAAGVRRLVSDCVARDPEVEIVGTAPDGRIGLAKIEQLEPDAVVLDVDMPGMSGPETVRRIRERRPALPVILFSSLSERSASLAIEALTTGASDCATKPSQAASLGQALQRVREDLLPRIKLLTRRSAELRTRAAGFAPPSLEVAVPAAPTAATGTGQRPGVIAISASTGGPAAVEELLGSLPASFDVPIVVVQHMPPVFTRLLAARLSRTSGRPFVEVRHGAVLRAGSAWVAPGGFHLRLERRGPEVVTVLGSEAPEWGWRPAADPFLRSVAEAFGEAAIAVVLTGMGNDGLAGTEEVRRRGGVVMAQDDRSSALWGMPGNVVRAGLAEVVDRPAAIAAEISRRSTSVRPGAVLDAPVREAGQA